MIKGTGASYYKNGQCNSVGVIFCAKNTGRHLYLLRSGKKMNEWGLPGGKVEQNESLMAALRRECLEEINYWVDGLKLFPIEQFTSEDGRFIYHTFYSQVQNEFMPELNHEHIGYCWVDPAVYPKPLHRGLFNTLNYDTIQQKIAIIRDSTK